jgi:predicted  nucleic acid-binding Zn-ribbon protein
MNGEALYELQQIDTALDQLRHRLGRLPEAQALADAERALEEHRAAVAAAAKQLADAEATIETIERQTGELTTKRARLEAQLKTVSEARHADALGHEIETIGAQRDELDDQELQAMEDQAQAEVRLAALAGDEDAVVALRDAAAALLQQAKGAAADEEAQLTARHQSARESLNLDEIALYDEQRARHGGVGIAKLVGTRCDGCHLDLSRAEVDAIKVLPAGELGDCPQCGRVLVR